MTWQREDFFAGRGVPQFGHVVLTAGQCAAAIGRERDGCNRCRVTFQLNKLQSSTSVPNPRRGVLAARDDPLAIGGKRPAKHGPLMSIERCKRFARRTIPNLGSLITAGC